MSTEIYNLSDLLDGKVDERRMFFTNEDLWNSKEEIEVSPPKYQRFFHAPISWQRNYVASFFIPSIVIPEIALRVGEHIPNKCAEVMDGCQRVSSAFAFKKGSIALPNNEELEKWICPLGYDWDLRNLKWKDLPRAAKETFEEYQMCAQIYKDISPSRAGYIFAKVLNNNNELNAQEERQATASKMSEAVQQLARTKPHGMFDCKKDKTGMKLDFINKATHKRLKVEQTLAELIYMMNSDEFLKKGTGKKPIDDFYDKNAKLDNFSGKKLLKEVLTFAEQSFKGYETAKVLPLKPWRNYCYIVSQFIKGGSKLHPIDFIKCYKTAHKNLKHKNLIIKGMSKTPYELFMSGPDGKDAKAALKMIKDEMKRIGYIEVITDMKRVFTRTEVADAYDEQDGICFFCSEKLGEFGENVHGHHISDWKDGCRTIPENCRATHSSCNWREKFINNEKGAI